MTTKQCQCGAEIPLEIDQCYACDLKLETLARDAEKDHADPIQDRPLPDLSGITVDVAGLNPVAEAMGMPPLVTHIPGVTYPLDEKSQEPPPVEAGNPLQDEILRAQQEVAEKLTAQAAQKSSMVEEMGAISAISIALDPLDPDSRQRAIDYVCNALQIVPTNAAAGGGQKSPTSRINPHTGVEVPVRLVPGDRPQASIEELDSQFTRKPKF